LKKAVRELYVEQEDRNKKKVLEFNICILWMIL
jgi:hypothetical protein